MSARRKSNPLTFEEHVALGDDLKVARDRLLKLVIRAYNSYGKSTRIGRRANRALISVDNLRCELDNLLCGSLPLTDDRWRGVYYGKRK